MGPPKRKVPQSHMATSSLVRHMVEVPAPERAEMGVPAPERAEMGVPAPERAEMGVPAPERAEMGVPAPERAEMGVPAPERAEMGVPAPEQVEMEVPAPERAAMNVNYVIQQDDLVIDYDKVLGRGAYATVYQGKYIGQAVAVKVFSQPMDIADVFEETELKLLLTIRHPNILYTYGVAEAQEGLVAMVSELATHTLSHAIFRSPTRRTDIVTCSLETKREFALQVTSAVKFLHDRQIGHFDIKPLNILIACKGDEKVAKLADMGLASYVQLFGTRTIGQQIGTPSYMAPELFQRSKPTPMCDVWALGITLLEMFTETRAWNNKFEKIPGCQGPLRQPQGYSKKQAPFNIKLLPKEFQSVVTEMTNYIPEERPTTVEVYKIVQSAQ